MDEALEEHRAAAGIDRVAVEIELHDVVGGDERRRQRARHQEVVGIGRMPCADMAEAVDHAELRKDAAADGDILEQGGRNVGKGLRAERCGRETKRQGNKSEQGAHAAVSLGEGKAMKAASLEDRQEGLPESP